jgi:FkbM family methyltransferase
MRGLRRTHRTLARFPALYTAAGRAETIGRLVLRRPHDPDYRWVSGPDVRLVVDVGGNRGQSAASFAVLCPAATVVSFEPNPAHTRDMRMLRWVLRGRLVHHATALADTEGDALLWIPVSQRRAVTGEGSLDPTALDRAARRVTVNGHTTVTVPVRTLDSYRLAPDVIKVDVQGTEAAVLRGAERTLAQHRPTVVVEAGAADEAVAAVMQPLGYTRAGGPRNWLWTPTGHGQRGVGDYLRTRRQSDNRVTSRCRWRGARR